MAKVLPRQDTREVKAVRAKARDIFPMEEQPIAVPLLVVMWRNPLLMVVRAAWVLADEVLMEVLVEAVEPDAVARVVAVDTLVVVDPMPVDMVVEALQRTTEPIRVTKAAYGTAMVRL